MTGHQHKQMKIISLKHNQALQIKNHMIFLVFFSLIKREKQHKKPLVITEGHGKYDVLCSFWPTGYRDSMKTTATCLCGCKNINYVYSNCYPPAKLFLIERVFIRTGLLKSPTFKVNVISPYRLIMCHIIVLLRLPFIQRTCATYKQWLFIEMCTTTISLNCCSLDLFQGEELN